MHHPSFHFRLLYLSALTVVANFFFASNPLPAKSPVFIPSERGLPVVGEVDLLVLGGTTGAVAAAAEAAREGAKVFLVSEYPYLGENLTATLRLWPGEGETTDDPLAARIFNDPIPPREIVSPYLSYLTHPERLHYRYEINGPIRPQADTDVSSALNDGKGTDVSREKIVVEGDASIIVDFGKEQDVQEIALLAYARINVRGYDIQTVEVSTSRDGNVWTVIGPAVRKTGAAAPSPDLEKEKGRPIPTALRDRLTPFVLSLEKPIQTRFLKIDALKPKHLKQMFLAELIFLPKRLELPESDSLNAAQLPRPLHVKRELDRVLLEAGVPFLYNSYLNAWIRNETGGLRGAVIANKAGRQAVLARRILHAPSSFQWLETRRGGLEQVEFNVIGGSPVEVSRGLDQADPLRNAQVFVHESPFYGPRHSGPPHLSTLRREADGWQPDIETIDYPVLRYRFDLLLPESFENAGDRWTFLMRLERRIRLASYCSDQAFTSDELYFRSSPATNKVDFPEKGLVRIPPDLSVRDGRKIGREIIESPCDAPIVFEELHVAPLRSFTGSDKTTFMERGDLKEMLQGIRTIDVPERTVRDNGSPWPILGEYDVIVVGGGTSGAAAGIGASRNGAKTLVIEHMHALGGVGTAGAVAVYYYGNRVGFTREVLDGKVLWRIEDKAHWWLKELDKAGGEAWLGTLAVGTIVEGRRVCGVAVATPSGPGVVFGKTVIDATGNGDIAVLAGSPMRVVDDSELALQGAGVPPRNLGTEFTNSDFMYVDENDVRDAVHVFVYAKEKYPAAFDQGKLLDTRERRRIVGDFTITVLDAINERTYPDTIVRSHSNFDSHGYTIDPYMELNHPQLKGISADVPFRCFLPQEIDGLLVAGMALSCHRDALPLLRMQADLQNQGYALGFIAAQAVQEALIESRSVDFRKIDIRKVQKHLVEIGNLEKDVLEQEDHYDSRRKELSAAVESLGDEIRNVRIVLWYPEESKPLVHRAYLEATSPEKKLVYAKVAAALGDPVGVETLIEKIESIKEWGGGWNFRSAAQFGPATGELDRLIMMLGRTRDPRGVPVILEKMGKLERKDAFSHHRACYLALEWIGNPSAAPMLAEMLKKSDMNGYVHDTLETAEYWNKKAGGIIADQARADSLLEIGYARALFRCGDHEKLGETILERYKTDRRGHFARHATEVLARPLRDPVQRDTLDR